MTAAGVAGGAGVCAIAITDASANPIPITAANLYALFMLSSSFLSCGTMPG
jgi:hypothetical protein